MGKSAAIRALSGVEQTGLVLAHNSPRPPRQPEGAREGGYGPIVREVGRDWSWCVAMARQRHSGRPQCQQTGGYGSWSSEI
jgi:hypothetical protein